MIYELHEDSETNQFGNLELDEEYDHVHYCSQCRHWYICKQTEIECGFASSSVTSHKVHIDSISQNQVNYV